MLINVYYNIHIELKWRYGHEKRVYFGGSFDCIGNNRNSCGSDFTDTYLGVVI